MKHLYLLLSLFLVATTQGQTQDTLYVWKAGNLVIKQSIKPADIDSITFKRPLVLPITMPSVTICEQIWTTTNLDVTTYSDGTLIPQVTDPTAWLGLTTGAWCYYNNDATNNATYGKLYNWYAVAGIYDAASLTNPTLRKKLAPTGWHVPTDTEWTTLTTCLGGDSVAGGKMKETGTVHWNIPNGSATNSSGFTALPSGSRDQGGLFSIGGNVGVWWSSSEKDPTLAWKRYLIYNFGYATRQSQLKIFGSAVRCLRD
jgi:uncharacterized protein (TIGR02145 family)